MRSQHVLESYRARPVMVYHILPKMISSRQGNKNESKLAPCVL